MATATRSRTACGPSALSAWGCLPGAWEGWQRGQADKRWLETWAAWGQEGQAGLEGGLQGAGGPWACLGRLPSREQQRGGRGTPLVECESGKRRVQQGYEG